MPGMLYRSRLPASPLCHFVEFFWYHQGYAPDYAMEKLLPDGAIEVVIDFEDSAKRLYDRDDQERFQSFRRAWISGQQKDFLVIESAQNSHMIGIRFRPGGAYPFFPFPLSELNGSVIELDLVWGRLASRLRDRLLETPGVSRKFEVLERFLLTQALLVLEIDRTLEFSLRQLRHAPESLSIRQLSEQIGISQKHLIHKFRRQVGLRPKLLSRIFKFQKVLASIEAERPLVWADLAMDCGYYDQSHFIREFQSFSGMNPTRYLVDRGEFFNWVPIR